MASITKYQTSVIGIIKHNAREFADEICPSNEDVDNTKSAENYSLITRGETAREIEQYRKEVMKDVFHYNRKNIVLCNEVVCTMPNDCPPEQEKRFFEESLKYIESTLPMGRQCILQAEVHKDEAGAPHLHVLYVPAVKDNKHDNYEYKLCSDQLTKRAVLKQWHPNYQKWIDEAGVSATVASGITGGKNISVKALKELTKETGLTIDEIKGLDKENKYLKDVLKEKEQQIELANERIKSLEEKEIVNQQWGKPHSWGTYEHTEGEILW